MDSEDKKEILLEGGDLTAVPSNFGRPSRDVSAGVLENGRAYAIVSAGGLRDGVMHVIEMGDQNELNLGEINELSDAEHHGTPFFVSASISNSAGDDLPSKLEALGSLAAASVRRLDGRVRRIEQRIGSTNAADDAFWVSILLQNLWHDMWVGWGGVQEVYGAPSHNCAQGRECASITTLIILLVSF